MRHGYAAMAGAVVLALASSPVDAAAAKAVNCVDQYLGCINVASQEEGAFWRTLKEAECGLDYYACIRDKATGA